jgi:hypothetical protein
MQIGIRRLLGSAVTAFLLIGGVSSSAVFAQGGGDFCESHPNHPSCIGDPPGNPPACDPSVYDDRWQVVGTPSELTTAITANPGTQTCIYVTPGAYDLSATVTIDRTTPLYIHGGDKWGTRLRAPGAGTVFTIVDVPKLNIANLGIVPNAGGYFPINPKAIFFEPQNGNPPSIDFEMLV